MRAVVTGAAGFIGSQLTEDLLADGWHVVGIDSFTDYYDRALKRLHIATATESDRFRMVEADLSDAGLEQSLENADVVFHLAGQPGVRSSWHHGFEDHIHCNIRATHALLEAALRAQVPRVVYASSSSVYGNAGTFPTNERTLPSPFSPYGVTKLAAEHLCRTYAANFNLHVTSVRYFTVYGPRQRPDMATDRLIRAALTGAPFPLFGDGRQRRDFTYVGDAVAATRLAGTVEVQPGSVYNVGGGSDVSMIELLHMVEEATQHEVRVDHRPAEPGDARRTAADTILARTELGWQPNIDLATGIAAQIAEIRRMLA